MRQGFCYLISKSQVISIDESLAGSFFSLGRNEIMGLPISGLLFITLAIIISIFLRKTVNGRNIYAIGDNEAGARICGVNIDQVKILVYSINGLLAAFAGIILTAKLGVGQPTVTVK